MIPAELTDDEWREVWRTAEMEAIDQGFDPDDRRWKAVVRAVLDDLVRDVAGGHQ